jgi:hypothetical protein
MSTLKRGFIVFLHIRVEDNPNNRIENKIMIFYMSWWIEVYLFQKILVIVH